LSEHTVLPLRLRRDARITDEQRDALWRIDGWDLDRVRERLLRTGATSPHRVDEILFELRRYLGLRVVFPQAITMFSDDVDEAWHACILFTRMYAELCQAVFGEFLHHEPGPEPDPGSAWREFEEAYRELYGDPAPVWEMWRP